MKTTSTFFLSFFIIILLSFASCSSEKKPLEVLSEPAQEIVDGLRGQDFSIVLNDMDVSEDDDYILYKHKYIIIKPKGDSLEIDSTDWKNVSESFFMKYEKDLGMEIISYHNGKFSTISKPVGFDWAVGNKKYGEWGVDSTSTNTHEKRWVYHVGSRFFLMHWIFSRRTPMGVYNNYATTSRGRAPFYGSGKTTYGTNSSYNKEKRSSFYKRKYSSKSWNKTYTKRKASRSSSRFSGSSRTRGRSGSFGK